MPVLFQIFGAGRGPVLPQPIQEPMGIQALHLFCHTLEQVIQVGVGLFQAALEAKMELPVGLIHPVVIRSVFFPDRLGVHRMEPCRMFQIKGLHICHLNQALIVTGHPAIPGRGAAFFRCIPDFVHRNDLVPNFLHQGGQNAFVNAREALGVRQIVHRQAGKALAQPGFCLSIAGQFVQLGLVVAVEPVRHKVIAVSLMGCGYHPIQPRQKILVHGPGGRRQQNMGDQMAQMTVIALLIPGGLRYHYPERLVCPIGYKALVDAVGVPVQAGTQNCFDDLIWLAVTTAGQHCHHCKVHLRGCRNIALQLLNCFTVFL